MNKYGALAMKHWIHTDPDRVEAIPDREAFFAELGEQVETQIQAMALALEGRDLPGEQYLEKVGRLNMARLSAEEAVLSELVWISPPQEETSPTTPHWVTQTLGEMHEELAAEDD
jgi:hypothetical protein